MNEIERVGKINEDKNASQFPESDKDLKKEEFNIQNRKYLSFNNIPMNSENNYYNQSKY